MQPVMIIGGGPAGAGAAIQLARLGRKVTLLEREAGPHDKVCGEFLSYEAVDALLRLGLDPVELGAKRVDRLAVCIGGNRTVAALPFRALSLSRKILDQAVLGRAQAEGVAVWQGARVTRLETTTSGWKATCAAGQTVEAEDVFLATGKHDLRGMRRPPGRQSDLIGLKVHLALPAAHVAQIEHEVSVHLFAGGYAGLEVVEGGRANLCLLVRKATFSESKSDWRTLVERLAVQCPQLAGVLRAGAAGVLRPLAISSIPYGHVQSTAERGIWRLGDQAAVIPSFAGEGMAMAFRSAEMACEFLLNGLDSSAYQRAFSQHVRARVVGATFLSQVMVSPIGQHLIGASLAVAPGLAQRVARQTRLPHWPGTSVDSCQRRQRTLAP